MRVIAEALSSAAFSQFGEVVEHAGPDRRRMLPDATAPDEAASIARMWVSRLDTPATLPLTISVLQQHQFSPQTFIPLEVSRYLVTVAPSDAVGRPISRKPAPLSSAPAGASFIVAALGTPA